MAGPAPLFRNSPSFTNNHMVLGLFDAIFPNVLPAYGSGTPIRRMGDVLNAGKLYMDTQNGLDFQTAVQTQAEHYLYHWFGDPTMQIYASRPLTFFVSKAAVSFLTSSEIQVILGQSDADGASVTLIQNGEPIGRALVSGSEVMIVPDRPIDPAKGGLSLAFDKTSFQPATLAIGGGSSL